MGLFREKICTVGCSDMHNAVCLMYVQLKIITSDDHHYDMHFRIHLYTYVYICSYTYTYVHM